MMTAIQQSHVDLSKVDLTKYDFPFENIVLEGGGSKGLAYCGALKLFEELGIRSRIKRVAGTSAGGIVALLMTLGYSADEIEDFSKNDLTTELMMDGSSCWKTWTFLPRLCYGYGLSKGDRITEYLAEKIEGKGFHRDISFAELYLKTNIELCIMTTDVNSMREVYCHVKTTPTLSVKMAVRTTLSIPGMFEPVQYKSTEGGNTNYYVDGGILCNYPIHCFDGWWLSMAEEDAYIHKISDLRDLPYILSKSERFAHQNKKTIGFVVFSDNEADNFRSYLERSGDEQYYEPDTPKTAKEAEEEKRQRDSAAALKALNDLLPLLQTCDTNSDGNIDEQEFENLLNSLPVEDTALLFGPETDPRKIFKMVDIDGSGGVTLQKLIIFAGTRGIDMYQVSLGYPRQDITSATSYAKAILNTMLLNLKRLYMESDDMARTVGINTGHVETTDFGLKESDVTFLLKKGRHVTEVFLAKYALKNNLPMKE